MTRTLRLVLTSLLLAVVVLGCNAPGGSTSLTCTVTYDANGASGGTVPTDPQSPYSSGAKVTVLDNTGNLYKSSVALAPAQIFRLASTIAPDWAFSGWNTRSDGTGTTYAPGQTFIITSNVTLYAVWKLGANFKRVPDDSRRQHLHQLANICLLWPATEKSGDSS